MRKRWLIFPAWGLGLRACTRFALLLSLAPLGGILVACGGDGGGDKAAETVTVERTVEEPPVEEDPGEPGEKRSPTEEDTGAGSSGGSITVPNVVGKDHQLAQDTMQSAGLYALDEEDCTGQGRLLFYDRNWTVVKQEPPAGSRVSEDETITLCSKKDGE